MTAIVLSKTERCDQHFSLGNNKQTKYTHTSTHARARAHTDTDTHTQARTHARTHAHTHTHTHAHTHTSTHARTHKYTHAAHTHTHTQIIGDDNDEVCMGQQPGHSAYTYRTVVKSGQESNQRESLTKFSSSLVA